ncbi:UNKNOWN [Stylonychia lemnae]|uniref:Uncharacterized protein n=1 Tax=Stylonychia lemnae TaxID=5949 RepID=A0A078BDV7_STYLE|nr:UNKNOWN [Stylonychia lemnae]|eukprot:CDW91763.1 UNKNOWN [Stylonychia lemnae]
MHRFSEGNDKIKVEIRVDYRRIQVLEYNYKLEKIDFMKYNTSFEYESCKVYENQDEVDEMKLEELEKYGDVVELCGVWNFKYKENSACCLLF